MCFSAIHWAQVPHIVYSTTIADVKKLGFNELSISNRLLKKKQPR
jgi:tRNA(Arg) A34 adenosine deaminase TadA